MGGFDRILTTHVGSLPRSAPLIELLEAHEHDPAANSNALQTRLRDDVADVVARQVALGVDLVSDGELSKTSYATYITDRLSGFGGASRGRAAQDLKDYPDYAQHLIEIGGTLPQVGQVCCIGPVAPKSTAELEADLANFRAAVDKVRPKGAFMNAASPGVVSVFQKNEFYPDEDSYIEAVAEALRPEYEAIIEAGFLLQVDAPDLAMGRHLAFARLSDEEFLGVVDRNVAAINHATRNIPAEKLRVHLCWGNYEGPHHHDIPLSRILDGVLKVNTGCLLLEGANPRHEHEWAVFEGVKLPEGLVLAPGVIDSTSNYIEHPELVAQRIERYASVVGRDRVCAGADCGFSTFRGLPNVWPSIAWKKLESLVAGAEIASRRLWS